MADLVLGIDAGNTKTVALLVEAGGRVRAWGRGGRSNIYVSKRAALAAIDRAGELALTELRGGRLTAVTLSATGADWPEDFTLLEAHLERRFPGARRSVINDAVGALHAGSPTGPAVAVVCGTSAGTAARGAQGQTWHSSYWQEPEGADELGERTLRAVYRADLGIDPPTALTGAVLAHFGQGTPAALLHAHTRRGRRPGRVGRLARVLLDVAATGDGAACQIVTEHGAALGDYALAAARQVGLDGPFELITAGGVMRHPAGLLQRALLARVRQAQPEVTWRDSPFEPVVGAALHALDTGSAAPPDDLHAALRASLPHAKLFQT